MSSQTDHSNSSRTLPPEELNPLVNPLLAQNMGRWAEVYFTALPENREQAVTDLLCELRQEASLQENASAPAALAATHPAVSDGADSSAPLVRCPQCGYENRYDHNFCGSCRAELRHPASAEAFFDALVPNTHAGEAQRPQAPPEESQSLTSEARESIDQLEADRLRFEQKKWKLEEPAPLQSTDRLSDDRPSNDRQGTDRQSNDRQSNDRQSSVRPFMDRTGSARQNHADLLRLSREAPRPRSYRVYFAAGLAILILFLLVRTWWGGRAAGTSQTAPQLSPAAAGETAGSSTAPVTPNSAASTADTSRPSQPPGAISIPNAAAKPKTDTRWEGVSHPPAPAAATDTEALPLAGNGAAELSLAKDYLNGSGGKQRDTTRSCRSVVEGRGQAECGSHRTALGPLPERRRRGQELRSGADPARRRRAQGKKRRGRTPGTSGSFWVSVNAGRKISRWRVLVAHAPAMKVY